MFTNGTPMWDLAEYYDVGDYDDCDDGNDYDSDNDDDGVDIYIMMKCVSVCLSRIIITSHFRAERWRREVSCLLGLAGIRPALASW